MPFPRFPLAMRAVLMGASAASLPAAGMRTQN